MKRCILFILLFLPAVLTGEENIVYNFTFVEGSSTYVFGDNVRVRKAPEVTEINIIDTLPAGYPVKILKKTSKVMAQNGFSEYWYSVSFSRNGKVVTGYIWGGLLAAGYINTGKGLLLLGFKSYGDDEFTGECRLIRDGRILSSINIKMHFIPSGEPDPFYGYSISLKLNDNMGLAGLDKVVSIYNDYGACGYPRGNVWVGIGGDRLYYIGIDSSVSEAGVFHYEEHMIFPSQDKTLKNEVRLVIESFDFDEKLNDYRLSDRREKRYIWKDFKLEERKQ